MRTLSLERSAPALKPAMRRDRPAAGGFWSAAKAKPTHLTPDEPSPRSSAERSFIYSLSRVPSLAVFHLERMCKCVAVHSFIVSIAVFHLQRRIIVALLDRPLPSAPIVADEPVRCRNRYLYPLLWAYHSKARFNAVSSSFLMS